MAAWSGFTDEDLRKIKGSNPQNDKLSPRNQAQRQAALRRQRQAQGAKVASTAKRGRGDDQPPIIEKRERHAEKKETQSAESSNPATQPDTQANHHAAEPTSQPEEQQEVKELDDNQALSVELDNVQKFQQQQKVIEEANKQKRALLARAIEDRRKRAKAEADKLVKVQQELNHLDSLLTADVGIIRDKIEHASLEYMDAQKRYEKAEKEFIAAKMDLYTKGEAKESLTEHLYTIIHQNEVRKARKLVELMEKLAMEVTPEEMELTMPAIPQLANFTAVSTLHDPNDPHHPLNVAQQQQKETQQDTQSQQVIVDKQPSEPQKHTQDQKVLSQQVVANKQPDVNTQHQQAAQKASVEEPAVKDQPNIGQDAVTPMPSPDDKQQQSLESNITQQSANIPSSHTEQQQKSQSNNNTNTSLPSLNHMDHPSTPLDVASSTVSNSPTTTQAATDKQSDIQTRNVSLSGDNINNNNNVMSAEMELTGAKGVKQAHVKNGETNLSNDLVSSSRQATENGGSNNVQASKSWSNPFS